MSSLKYFTDTLAVVLGILAPLLLLIWSYIFKNEREMLRERKQHQYKEQEQRGPYSKITLHEVPNDRMLNVKLWRDDELVWSEGVYKP